MTAPPPPPQIQQLSDGQRTSSKEKGQTQSDFAFASSSYDVLQGLFSSSTFDRCLSRPFPLSFLFPPLWRNRDLLFLLVLVSPIFCALFPSFFSLADRICSGDGGEGGKKKEYENLCLSRPFLFYPSFLLIDIRLAAAAPEKSRGFRKYRIHFSPSLFAGCFISPPFPRNLNRIYPPRP